MNSVSDKIFLAIVIIISNTFSRDELLGNAKIKCDKFCKNHKDIMKLVLFYSIFYSYTREHSTSIIGTILFALFDNIE